MTNGKPRGRNPSLIGGTNGRPKRAEAKKRCKCFRCQSPIEMEEVCFDIPKVGGAFSTTKRFCRSCFQNVLKQTTNDLDELRNL